MNRRNFIKTLSIATMLPLTPSFLYAGDNTTVPDADIKDYLYKMAHFNQAQKNDVILSSSEKILLNSTLARLKRVQRTIGYGNFYILNFDDSITFARRYHSIGDFTSKEKTFLDKMFNFDATEYGFYGTKPVTRMTTKIHPSKVTKVPHTGNFLYKGKPLELYNKIQKDLGKNVYLTSGVRGVMKQFVLFLSKAKANDGNLSLASRSLAPPGYSYHAVGDFDVGQKGLGAANFSSKFSETKTFKMLKSHGYLKLRYPQKNMLGVRFEPWHIRVDEAHKKA